MREIKFRVWDVENGYMITSKQGVFTALRNVMDITRQDDGYYNNGELLKPNKNKYELMQFTGLYDKNKVPIYEGDIVKKPEWMGCYDEEICLCIYNQENNTSPVIGFGLYTKSKLTGRYQDLVESDEWDECEVIGNIYENSNLLGE